MIPASFPASFEGIPLTDITSDAHDTDHRAGVWHTRTETPADTAAVRAVYLAAFETPQEADLVDALRADPSWLPGLSYVAEGPDGSVAAHALLTRCEVGGAPALALAPVAADPAIQRSGAGSAVVRALLAAARERGRCWSWSSGIRRTTRASASYRLHGSASGHRSRFPTRP